MSAFVARIVSAVRAKFPWPAAMFQLTTLNVAHASGLRPPLAHADVSAISKAPSVVRIILIRLPVTGLTAIVSCPCDQSHFLQAFSAPLCRGCLSLRPLHG